MLQGQALDLDHGDPGAVGYLGMVHASCNRRAGGRLGRDRLRAKLRAERERRMSGFVSCAVGVEISEDRLHVSLGIAGRREVDGPVTLSLAAYLDGTGSALDEVVRLAEEVDPVALVIDPHSQAATLLDPLEKRKVRRLVRPSTSDVVVAHGLFIDELAAGRIRHIPHPRLDEAARAGTQRRLAGAQTWDRRVGVDVSPLTATTLALWGFLTGKAPPAELVCEIL